MLRVSRACRKAGRLDRTFCPFRAIPNWYPEHPVFYRLELSGHKVELWSIKFGWPLRVVFGGRAHANRSAPTRHQSRPPPGPCTSFSDDGVVSAQRATVNATHAG